MDLGRPIFNSIDALWCIEVDLGNGKVVPCAFSREQALEIARRITEYYGTASQAGAHNAGSALGGPEALKKPIANTA